MKTKLLIALLAITSAVCCVFAFTACDDENNANSGNDQNTEQGGSGEEEFLYEKVAGTAGLEYTLSDDGTYYYFSGLGTCTETEIVIGNYYNGKPVKQVGKYNFITMQEIEDNELVIDDDWIDSESIFLYSNVTSVIVSEGISTIGLCVFSCFYHVNLLENIILPESLTTICVGAFQTCDELKTLIIPDNVTTIGEHAFSYCSGLTKIAIPDSVTSIGDGAFSGCSGLTEINVAAGNNYYSSTGNCLIEKATKTLILGLNDSIIPDDGSVTIIGAYAFYDCVGLTEITIPEGVASIGDNAFSFCRGLTEITIADSVTSIGIEAFFWCRGLTDIYFNGTKEQWGAIDKGYNWNYASGNYMSGDYTMHFNGEDDTNSGNDEEEFLNEKVAGTAGLEYTLSDDGTYYYFSGLGTCTETEIVIGNYYNEKPVKQIGKYACETVEEMWEMDLSEEELNELIILLDTNVKSIKVSEGITTIGLYVLAYSNISSIMLPESLTSIGRSAFEGCLELTNITITDNINKIGEYAFCDCTGLTEITIPDSVTVIGEGVFFRSSSLTDINFSGTKEQWQEIEKGYEWDYNTGYYTVHCTDGDIAK